MPTTNKPKPNDEESKRLQNPPSTPKPTHRHSLCCTGSPHARLCTPSALDLLHQEVDSLIRPARVIQMRRPDRQRALAYQVAVIADDFGLGGVEVVDLPVVLLVLRVAERDCAHDLGLHGGVEGFHDAVHHCCALAVADDHDVGGWARRCGFVDEGGHCFDAVGIGASVCWGGGGLC